MMKPASTIKYALLRRPLHPSRRDRERVREISRLSDGMASLSSNDLRMQAAGLKARYADETPLEDLVPQGFALAKESVRRTLGKSYYDVQLMAGLAMVRGCVAEMAAGEGKTLVAVLPAFLRALAGCGVHVITANRYLARRDYELLAPVYRCLGLSVGVVTEGMSRPAKIEAYQADVTYAVGYELGFDYLRDQLELLSRPHYMMGQKFLNDLRGETATGRAVVQRGHHCAIVDEIDSVLIDEARTPLVISVPGSEDKAAEDLFRHADRTAQSLEREQDFLIDDSANRIVFTERGAKAVEALRPGQDVMLLRPWAQYVTQSIRARHLLQRDVNYIVEDGRVLLVDEYTGRRFGERSWRDGLHQAVQTKEGVAISAENRTAARVTRQRYFSLYDHTCGMTGSASEGHQELWRFYRMPVVVVPTRIAPKRIAYKQSVYSDHDAKWAGIAADVARIHATGQPVLVGTRTVADSERVAALLKAAGINYSILNAKQDKREAEIISRAGAMNAVTIATNMAGRGADIPLGPGVEEKGGLYVVAAERYESRRVDRQLIGRSARNGEPGACSFAVSFDDPIITAYAQPRALKKARTLLAKEKGNRRIGRLVDRAQKDAEKKDYNARLKLYRYDSWLEETIQKLTTGE